MPLYFLHLRDGHDVLLDQEGTEYRDVAAAAAGALRSARSIIGHDALDGTIKLAQRIEVEDENHQVVHRLAFKDAITISGG